MIARDSCGEDASTGSSVTPAAAMKAGIDGALKSVQQALNVAQRQDSSPQSVFEKLVTATSSLQSLNSSSSKLLNDLSRQEQSLNDRRGELDRHWNYLDEVKEVIKQNMGWLENESRSTNTATDSESLGSLLSGQFNDMKAISEQLSELNAKLTGELEQESEENTRLKAELQKVQTENKALTNIIANLKTKVECHEAKLECRAAELETEKRMRNSMEALHNDLKSVAAYYQEIVTSLKGSVEKLSQDLQSSKSECEARLQTQADEHASSIAKEKMKTENATHQAIQAEESLKKCEAENQRLEKELATFRQQLKEAKAIIDLGNQTAGQARMPTQQHSVSTKRANDDQDCDDNPLPKDSKRPRLAAAPDPMGCFSAKVVPGLQSAASPLPPPPPPSILKKLSLFDIPDNVAEVDLDKVLEQHFQSLDPVARSARIRLVMSNVKPMATKDITPRIQTLVRVAYWQASDSLKSVLRTSGDYFWALLFFVNQYKECGDPDKNQDMRAYIDLCVRWDHVINVPQKWHSFTETTKGIATLLRGFHEKVEELGGYQSELWTSDGPLTRVFYMHKFRGCPDDFRCTMEEVINKHLEGLAQKQLSARQRNQKSP